MLEQKARSQAPPKHEQIKKFQHGTLLDFWPQIPAYSMGAITWIDQVTGLLPDLMIAQAATIAPLRPTKNQAIT